ncbi:MAG: hypothetical protein ABL907_20635 [Hyphomicrobium sp.]
MKLRLKVGLNVPQLLNYAVDTVNVALEGGRSKYLSLGENAPVAFSTLLAWNTLARSARDLDNPLSMVWLPRPHAVGSNVPHVFCVFHGLSDGFDVDGRVC